MIFFVFSIMFNEKNSGHFRFPSLFTETDIYADNPYTSLHICICVESLYYIVKELQLEL